MLAQQGQKSTQTRAVGITNELHPYISFIEALLLEKNVECTSSVVPTALVCVFFGPAVPSLLLYAIFC